ncbi:MAG: PHP domain-containing protein [Eubacterium sp.]|nr:PHP domain-containing protein [Eubacterium sp.]
MSYIYETHLHTCEASKCAKAHGADYIDYMRNLGYIGIIVTDHFFNGNTCIPETLPWKERVDLYVTGYEAAYRAAQGKDFSVFFGIEYNFECDEYLIYGIDKNWLYENADLLSKTRHEVYDLVHAAGGIMVQAHPYRERYYIKQINLTPSICDGIEIFNAGNQNYMNSLAYKYAEKLGLPTSSGSDIHNFYDGIKGGMMFERKIESIEDYVKAFKNREGTPIVLDNGTIKRVDTINEFTTPTKEPTLEVVYHS